MTAKNHLLRHHAAAVAAALLLGLWAASAQALSLGRLQVLSALGEPLRAEIAVPDITEDEAANLRVGVASPESFRAAGVEYNSALTGLQIVLQRPQDGRASLRLSTERPINEPFLDLILEARWASGRIVRDYTLLLDPPRLRKDAQADLTAPQVGTLPPANRLGAVTSTAPSTPAEAPRAEISRAEAPASIPNAAPTPTPTPTPAPPAPPAATPLPAPGLPSRGANAVTIKPGDTASKIAAANPLPGVSLDQMLVAMLRASPEAFIRGNLNRIRAGAVMNLPDAEQANAISAGEARVQVIAHSKDFSGLRDKLAENAPTATPPSPDRKASGRIQARVEDKKPTAATPDKLTLSKGGVSAKANEENIARERRAQDNAARLEEISRNLAALNQLAAAAPGAAAPAANPAASQPAGPAITATPPLPMTSAAAPTPAASAATADATPASTASAPTAPAAPAPGADGAASAPRAAASKPVAATPAQNPEPSLLDDLLENPLVPPAAAGLLALLAALGWSRVRQRQKASRERNAAQDSRTLPAESALGAAALAQAQADELPDAGPDARPDIEPDTRPDNEPGSQVPQGQDASQPMPAAASDGTSMDSGSLQPSVAGDTRVQSVNRESDLDLDLDFSLDTAAPAASNTASGPSGSSSSEAAPPLDPALAALLPDLSLEASPPAASSDLAPTPTPPDDVSPAPSPGSEQVTDAPTTQSPNLQAAPSASDLPDDLLAELSIELPPSPPSAAAPALDFDLAGLSLDLGDTPTPTPQAPTTAYTSEYSGAGISGQAAEAAAGSAAELLEKLDQAQALDALGDRDSARALLHEVLAQASGEIRARAQAALDQLG